VLAEARDWIGAPGYRIRGSASYASAVYSGVFCLLALRGARDWRRGEAIQLQELQDHHIFPQAYLKRHGLTKKADLNTIANRTLISNETNAKICDKPPASYVVDPEIFPSGTGDGLLGPHFIDPAILELMKDAAEALPDEEAAELYHRFVRAREQGIIAEIRRVCGIDVAVPASPPGEEPVDELAPDVLDLETSLEDELVELAMD
jgi:hypothetical protein